MNPNDKGINKPRKQLRKDAIPTLFVIPNPPKQPQQRRKLERAALAEHVAYRKPTSKHSTYTGKTSKVELQMHNSIP